jgi:predicted nucleic acid-binding protein
MRFLDANVFIYAYYKPKKTLSQKEMDMKDNARNIVTNIIEGKEDVLTTVVHLSEMVNILKHVMPLDEVSEIIRGLFMLDNVRIADVTRNMYFEASELSSEFKLDANDVLALDVMELNGIDEVYSFDEDFDRVDGIKRLPTW